MSTRRLQLQPALFQLETTDVVRTSTHAGVGKESQGDQSPEAGRNSGVERKLDLARDGSAGVRKSREGMET